MSALALATVSPRALAAADVELTANEWAQLLGVTKKAFTLRRVPHARMVARAGGLTKVYPFADLPPDYRAQLEEQRRRQGCWSYAELLNVRAVETRWEPAKEIGTLPPASQEKATRVREVMAVYFAASEAGMTLSAANQRARAKWVEVFGEECNEKTVRRWADKIEARGGPQFAPLEAYADNKSVPHERARLAHKLEISPDLLAEFKCRCVDNERGAVHIAGAIRSLEMDWQNGRAIPGLGLAPRRDAPFPFTYHQLRPFAPATAVRRLGTMGKAAALREALPHGKQTAAFLRRMELVVMDDSRVADWLDDKVPLEWLKDLLCLIAATPHLDWLLLTKRPEHFHARIAAVAEGWSSSCELAVWWARGVAPRNVWVGATVEDQVRADERLPLLVNIPARVRFLSCEPLLGPVDLRRLPIWRRICDGHEAWHCDDSCPREQLIHWIICGGESGDDEGVRPLHPDWARSLRDQCRAAEVPFFFKQWGEWLPVSMPRLHFKGERILMNLDGKIIPTDRAGIVDSGGEFYGFERHGKHASGRQLCGRTHSGFPASHPQTGFPLPTLRGGKPVGSA